MDQAIGGWTTVVENQPCSLFDGKDSSISLLATMTANSQLMECNGTVLSVSDSSDNSTNRDLELFIQKAFFGFSIPPLWTVSGASA